MKLAPAMLWFITSDRWTTKSTLVGRLLSESELVAGDHLVALEAVSNRAGNQGASRFTG
jgi:sulfate adenylyltransferase subunit 1 (EFTu-like GTPase family)